MRRVMERLPQSRQHEVTTHLDRAAAMGRDFIMLVVLSCTIATFGLILNSGAVIIGAMLIAPLMSPILALALALVRGDLARAGRALATLVGGTLLAVGLSAGLGWLVTGSQWNFLEQLPTEVLSRTQPTLFDLVVALAGGAAAAYALAQPGLSSALPGVAIATALMPPLCVVGLGVSLGRADISVGAVLLFLANFVAIIFASSVLFAGLGFHPEAMGRPRYALYGALLGSGTLLLLVTVPLSLFMVRIVHDVQENATIRTILVNRLSTARGAKLVGFDRQWDQQHLDIVATVRSPHSLAYADVHHIESELASRLQQTVALEVLVVPVTRVAPLAPPTPTRTSQARVTATRLAHLAPALTPTPRPTATITPRPTATATPRPPATPRWTTTPRTAATPTVTPVAYAVIGETRRQGANVRRAPGLTAVVAALPDGTIVQLTGGRTRAEGWAWVQVVSPDGRVGWIAQDYLVPYRTYIPPYRRTRGRLGVP